MKLTFRIEYRTAGEKNWGWYWTETIVNLSSFALQTGNIGKVKLKCRTSLHACLFPTAMEYIVTDSASAVKAEPWLICFAPEKKKKLPLHIKWFLERPSGWILLIQFRLQWWLSVWDNYKSHSKRRWKHYFPGPYALVCIISVKCWLSAEIARL